MFEELDKILPRGLGVHVPCEATLVVVHHPEEDLGRDEAVVSSIVVLAQTGAVFKMQGCTCVLKIAQDDGGETGTDWWLVQLAEGLVHRLQI